MRNIQPADATGLEEDLASQLGRSVGLEEPRWIPSARVFVSQPGEPVKVRLEVAPHAFSHGLNESVVQKIISTTSRQQIMSTGEEGRSLYWNLAGEESFTVNGKRFLLAKAKPVTYRGQPPVLEAFNDEESEIRQPGGRLLVDSQTGRISTEPATVRPKGGGYLDEAIHEYALMLEAFERGVPTAYPFAIGEFPDLVFQGRPLGFVVMALESEKDIRYGDTAASAFGQLGKGAPQSRDRIIEIAKSALARLTSDSTAGAWTLRQLLEAGIVHTHPHPHNFSILRDGRAALYDFTNAKSIRQMSRDEFITRAFNDWRSFYLTTWAIASQGMNIEQFATFRKTIDVKVSPNRAAVEAFFAADDMKRFGKNRVVNAMTEGNFLNFLAREWNPTALNGKRLQDLQHDSVRIFSDWAGSLYDRLTAQSINQPSAAGLEELPVTVEEWGELLTQWNQGFPSSGDGDVTRLDIEADLTVAEPPPRDPIVRILREKRQQAEDLVLVSQQLSSIAGDSDLPGSVRLDAFRLLEEVGWANYQQYRRLSKQLKDWKAPSPLKIHHELVRGLFDQLLDPEVPLAQKRSAAKDLDHIIGDPDADLWRPFARVLLVDTLLALTEIPVRLELASFVEQWSAALPPGPEKEQIRRNLSRVLGGEEAYRSDDRNRLRWKSVMRALSSDTAGLEEPPVDLEDLLESARRVERRVGAEIVPMLQLNGQLRLPADPRWWQTLDRATQGLRVIAGIASNEPLVSSEEVGPILVFRMEDGDGKRLLRIRQPIPGGWTLIGSMLPGEQILVGRDSPEGFRGRISWNGETETIYSGKHFSVRWDDQDDAILVEDVGSSWGTYLLEDEINEILDAAEEQRVESATGVELAVRGNQVVAVVNRLRELGEWMGSLKIPLATLRQVRRFYHGETLVTKDGERYRLAVLSAEDASIQKLSGRLIFVQRGILSPEVLDALRRKNEAADKEEVFEVGPDDAGLIVEILDGMISVGLSRSKVQKPVLITTPDSALDQAVRRFYAERQRDLPSEWQLPLTIVSVPREAAIGEWPVETLAGYLLNLIRRADDLPGRTEETIRAFEQKSDETWVLVQLA